MRAALAEGIVAEIVQASGRIRIDARARSRRHILVVYEQGRRQSGETLVDDGSRSSLRNLSRRMTFVPAGHELHERHEHGIDISAICFYLAPSAVPQLAATGDAADAFAPRVLFDDPRLLDTALKIKSALEGQDADSRSYCEALAHVLAHEIRDQNPAAATSHLASRGGLAAWQQRRAAAYIEEHIAETIPLTTMAELVRLSPYHFCRAFKRSFGVPPHRYHALRRIERAKHLLLNHDDSITRIALEVGFCETSSFSAAFRKIAGVTPTEFKRAEGNFRPAAAASGSEYAVGGAAQG